MKDRSHGAPPVGERTGDFTGAFGAAAGGRDIYPLPLFPASQSADAAPINDCLRALNWMASGSTASSVYSDSNAMQRETVARVQRVVERWKLGQDAPSGGACLREVLRGRGLYASDSPAANVAPFQSSRVSLPADVVECPNLLDLLSDETREKLQGDLQQIL